MSDPIYCVKCRKKVYPKDVEVKEIVWTHSTGKPGSRAAAHGSCPDCGVKVRKFVRKSPAPEKPKVEEQHTPPQPKPDTKTTPKAIETTSPTTPTSIPETPHSFGVCCRGKPAAVPPS